MKNRKIESTYSWLRLFVGLIFLLSIFSPVYAILEEGKIRIFAVTDDQKGMAADLFMYAIPGNGQAAFVTSNSLVGKDTQSTGNIALEIAQEKSKKDLKNSDIIFDIRADASEVDGPSAGAAMALLAYSMLLEKPISNEVALTGTINRDGSIGMVGGVGAKAIAASKAGIKLFMIPVGEAVSDIHENGTFETVNILEYGPEKLGMKIVEVSTIDHAINYAYLSIDEIKVDSNITAQIFVPESISYDKSLEPMKKISQNFVDNAKEKVDSAKKALDESKIPDTKLAELYAQYSVAGRSVEMAKRFLDQNYLYSSANYAFNADVLAGTIKEIAENPSLLEGDKQLFESKITSLKKELELAKNEANFISVNEFEWVIGAQQRLAYAENALNKIDLNEQILVKINGSDGINSEIIDEQANFEKVYDYVSARDWILVARDFLDYAQKEENKKAQVYSEQFTKIVDKKIQEVEIQIKDSNVSQGSKSEAERRLDSAKISRGNGFLLAALYDAHFADAFINSELGMKNFSSQELFDYVDKEIKLGKSRDSIWASLFFDHAKFYYQNTLFNRGLARIEESDETLQTSYELIYLSDNIQNAKSIVEEYIAFNSLPAYVSNKPAISVVYKETNAFFGYWNILIVILAVLFVILILVIFGIIKSRRERVKLHARHAKLKGILGNLDHALSNKKISQSEYFLMRKKYEDEISHKSNIKAERKLHKLGVLELKAKLSALEKGRIDLRRHFTEGVILYEDYFKHKEIVDREIQEIKEEINHARVEENELKSALISSRKPNREKEKRIKESYKELMGGKENKQKASSKKTGGKYAYKGEKKDK